MRKELNRINKNGTVVIGEGEMDENVVIGERLGTLNGPAFDIAVDPEGTKLLMVYLTLFLF